MSSKGKCVFSFGPNITFLSIFVRITIFEHQIFRRILRDKNNCFKSRISVPDILSHYAFTPSLLNLFNLVTQAHMNQSQFWGLNLGLPISKPKLQGHFGWQKFTPGTFEKTCGSRTAYLLHSFIHFGTSTFDFLISIFQKNYIFPYLVFWTSILFVWTMCIMHCMWSSM